MGNNLATRDDLKELKKDLTNTIEEAVGQIVSATSKSFEQVGGRLGKVEVGLEDVKGRLGKVEDGLSDVKVELKDVKRKLSDLETDLPSALEIKNHEKRLSCLEKTVFNTP